MTDENMYEVLGLNEQGNTIVRLPNSFEVNIPTKNSQQAKKAASIFYERTKKDLEKDKLLYTDILANDPYWEDQYRELLIMRDSNVQNQDWWNNKYDLMDKFVSEKRWRDMNLSALALSYMRTSAAGDKQKQLEGVMQNYFDNLPNFHETGGAGWTGLAANVYRGVADPTNLIGGVLAKGGMLALKVYLSLNLF